MCVCAFRSCGLKENTAIGGGTVIGNTQVGKHITRRNCLIGEFNFSFGVCVCQCVCMYICVCAFWRVYGVCFYVCMYVCVCVY